MIALFVAGACVVGFGIFAMLVRGEPERGYFRGLLALLVPVGLAGFAMLRLLPHATAQGGPDGAVRLVVALSLLWLCWIGVMAFVSQALRLRFPQGADMVLLAGGLATLAPAAGLVVSLWMS